MFLQNNRQNMGLWERMNNPDFRGWRFSLIQLGLTPSYNFRGLTHIAVFPFQKK